MRTQQPTDALPGESPKVPWTIRVLVLSGPDQGKELLVERGTYYVGKAEGCDLELTDGAVSRRHLELAVRQDGIFARDLGSKNGSFFAGARFSEMTLGPGAVITLGTTEIKLMIVSESQRILPSHAERFGALLGRSLAMRELFALLERIAESDAPVLIEGETGTGKELCAEALHQGSRRSGGPLVVCDLAGVARSLIESELFGHKRGAFTGADLDRVGAFEQAQGGTILVDEIGELELAAQPRLLRAIEQHRIKRVGDTTYRELDVRVIAATNRNLGEECEQGRFREDLFHRLAVLRVRLPPLRERKEDLPLLVAHFLSGRDVKVAEETLALFGDYDWPGNVRELRNLIERGVSLLGEDRLLTPHLLGVDSPGSGAGPLPLAGQTFHAAKEQLLFEWERGFVADLVRRAGGNISLAARRGGLGRPYLYRLMKKHGIDSDGDSE